MQKSIARGKLKFAKLLRLKQKYFVNFVDFGYCNSAQSVLYYRRSKEVQSNGKVKQPTLTKANDLSTTGSWNRNGASAKVVQAMKANV